MILSGEIFLKTALERCTSRQTQKASEWKDEEARQTRPKMNNAEVADGEMRRRVLAEDVVI